MSVVYDIGRRVGVSHLFDDVKDSRIGLVEVTRQQLISEMSVNCR